MTDWDDAYANAAYIPGSARWPEAWSIPAAAYRAEMLAEQRARLDLSYGAADRQRFDLFLPPARPRGLLVFVHGGYWLAFDKSSWSHFARGAVDRGYAVAMPSYRLCPDVRITAIAQDIADAVAAAGAMVDGPLLLAGHSAGGQLVARLATTTTPLRQAMQRRLRRVTAISGLHDLQPLMQTRMNATLRIDAGEALRESPAYLKPLSGVVITAWVGAAERPAFIGQNDLLASVWPGVTMKRAADRHHFDVLDPLDDARSDLIDAVVGVA
jgi:arylformamidase